MNNKKGVKLLAAVMAFAMVLVAGFAIIGGAEEADAAVVGTETPCGASELTGSDLTATSKITSTKEVTVKNAAVDIELYIKTGVTVTLNGYTGNTGTITVQMIKSDGINKIPNDVTVVIDDFTAGSMTITGTYGTSASAGSNIIIGGAPTATVSATQATVGMEPVPTGSVGFAADGFTYSTSTMAYTSFSVRVTSAATSTTFYGNGTATKDVGDVTLTDNNSSITIVKGSAVVSQAGNIIEMKEVTSTAGVTVTGPTSPSTIPVISGTFSTTTSVKVASGLFAITSISNVTTPTYVEMTDSSNAKFIGSQMVSNIAGNTIKAADIYGNITQKVSAETTVAASEQVTVKKTAVYVINEGVTVKTKTFETEAPTLSGQTITVVGGEARIFGTVNATTSYANNGITKIGPVGSSVSAITNGAKGSLANTLVASGADATLSVKLEGEIGDYILGGDVTVPAGKTATITGNLGMSQNKIIVNGTLIVNAGASIFSTGTTASDIIQLGTSGKIVNNGVIGAARDVVVANGAGDQTVTICGVSGAEFAYKDFVGNTDPSDDTLSVTGNIQKVRTASAGTITISGANIYDDLTIGKNVTLTLSSATTSLKGSVITIDGVLSDTTTYDLTLGELGKLIVNGTIVGSGEVNVTLGSYNTNTNAFTAGTPLTLTVGTNAVSGFTVWTDKYTDKSGETVSKYLRAYIDGEVKCKTGDESDTTSLGVSGADLYVAEGSTLVIDKADTMTTSSVDVIVLGTILIEDRSAAMSTFDFQGALYFVKDGNTTNGYITPFESAMDVIATAEDKTLTVKVKDIDFNLTLNNGETINFNQIANGKIVTTATVTLKSGSTFSNSILDVQGKLIIENGANASAPASYASKKVDAAGTATYAGFAVAVKDAQKGDTITVGTATVDESLTITEGVTIIITERLSVNGDLTVPAESKLVGGTIVVTGSASKTAKVTVAGEMDLSNGGRLSGSNNALYSTGTVILDSTYAAMNGAYYTNADNKVVLTTIAKAIAANAGEDITVTGTVTETDDITVDGFDINIAGSTSAVVLGKVNLNEGSITSAGKLTATVNAMGGKGDAATESTVKVTKSVITIASTNVTNVEGVTTYTLSVSAINGEVEIVKGVVSITETVTAANKSKLTVDSGAELLIASNTTTIDTTKCTLVVDGTLSVKGALDINGAKAFAVTGTIAVQKDGSFDVDSMNLTGTVTVDEEGQMQITASGVSVGAPIASLGADKASLVGKVTLASNNYVKVYDGADLSKAKITDAKKTVFYVNGVLYATVYAVGDVDIVNANEANSPITMDELEKISGVADFAPTVTKIPWKTVEGTAMTVGAKVGSVDALYVTMDPLKATILPSVGEGISLWVDGVRYNTGETFELAAGKHTVVAKVNPGYSGTTQVTFDGKAVNTGEIDITSAMVESGTYVLSATGDITIDAGTITEKTDDGMGITDYLLIVLVILAAILVVVVAIRMMRS